MTRSPVVVVGSTLRLSVHIYLFRSGLLLASTIDEAYSQIYPLYALIILY